MTVYLIIATLACVTWSVWCEVQLRIDRRLDAVYVTDEINPSEEN